MASHAYAISMLMYKLPPNAQKSSRSCDSLDLLDTLERIPLLLGLELAVTELGRGVDELCLSVSALTTHSRKVLP